MVDTACKDKTSGEIFAMLFSISAVISSVQESRDINSC